MKQLLVALVLVAALPFAGCKRGPSAPPPLAPAPPAAPATPPPAPQPAEELAPQLNEYDRLKTVSYGKEVPVCQQSNEECWSRNRRDHFAVTGKVR